MIVAETVVRINGGILVLPLKSIRFSVNTAMDANDEMSDMVRQWFKVHTAMDGCTLCAMLAELDEEKFVIKGLLEKGRRDDVDRLFDEWMAFDNYPDNRRECDEMINEWKKAEKSAAHTTNQSADSWGSAWTSFMRRRGLPHSHHDAPYEAHKLQYRHNGMVELLAAEERVCRESTTCKDTKDASLVRQNALRLERYDMHHDAIDMYERLRGLDSDESHALFHIATVMQYELNDPKPALKYWNMFLKKPPR